MLFSCIIWYKNGFFSIHLHWNFYVSYFHSKKTPLFQNGVIFLHHNFNTQETNRVKFEWSIYINCAKNPTVFYISIQKVRSGVLWLIMLKFFKQCIYYQPNTLYINRSIWNMLKWTIERTVFIGILNTTLSFDIL